MHTHWEQYLVTLNVYVLIIESESVSRLIMSNSLRPHRP